MQQYFSDQFRQLAAVTLVDPYLAADGTGLMEGLQEGAINVEEETEDRAHKETLEAQLGVSAPPGLDTKLIKNPVAPFGVQRTTRNGAVSSPYSPEQKQEVERKKAEKEKQRMSALMKPNDTGQS